MGRSQLAQHGGCGHCVGRGDNRTERYRRCPWHCRYEGVGDGGDGAGRESDREDDQTRYWRPVVPEISGGRVESRIEQHRCDEERQRQLGGHRKRRHARNKGEQRTAERQKDWIGCSDAARHSREDHGRDEQSEKLFELPHILRLRPYRFARPGRNSSNRQASSGTPVAS
jgi:hypothetical protein